MANNELKDVEVDQWLLDLFCNENTMNDYYPTPDPVAKEAVSDHISPALADELEDGFDIFVQAGYQVAKPARKPRVKKVLSAELAALQLPVGMKARKVRGKSVLVVK